MTHDAFVSTHWETPLAPALQRVYASLDDLLGLQFAEALGCLHTRGVAHDDVKPDNIVVAFKLDDQKRLADVKLKLIDFGNAKVGAPRTLVRMRDGAVDASA